MTSGLTGLELDVDTPSRMTILHPRTNLPIKDKDGNEAYVEVYSTDSDKARKFGRAVTTSRLRARNPNAMTGEKLENENVELLAELTTGWKLLDLEGQPVDLPFSRQAAIELYANHKMNWLYEQVQAFASSRANFGKASSTN